MKLNNRTSVLTEETYYYPWGLTMAGISGNYHAGWTGTFTGVSMRWQLFWAGMGESVKGKNIGRFMDRAGLAIFSGENYGDNANDYRYNRQGMLDAKKEMNQHSTSPVKTFRLLYCHCNLLINLSGKYEG